jgi:hypothetical protein
MIASDITCVAIEDLARGVGKARPDAFPASIFQGCPFDLVTGGCRAPYKIIWKWHSEQEPLLTQNYGFADYLGRLCQNNYQLWERSQT